MTAAFAKLKTHFANWREWELNPIVIKELRQGVRSWTVTGMLLLFLVVLFITSLGFLITESFSINANMGLGGSMFTFFMVILAGASVFFIPLYTGVRVAAERQENNPDLLYVTTLTPTRIIFGKFLCSAYIVLLFFSACMPFMAFTNLLRGVDLPTVFFILTFLFMVVCAVNMVAIFLSCLPLSRAFKFLLIIAGLLLSIFVIYLFLMASYEIMRSGVGAMMTDRDFWIATITVGGLIVSLTGLLFVLSVALISPPSANRALAPRIYIIVFWLLGGVLATAWVVQTKDASLLTTWIYPTFGLMVMALLVTISNSDHLSARVKRTIPRLGLTRFFAFFLFNGAAGGLGWIAAIFVATSAVTQIVMSKYPTTAVMSGDAQEILIAMTAYAFAYAMTALFLHRKFLPSRPPKLAGLLAILLAGAWAIAPSIFLFFVNRLSWKSVEGLQLGNIFNVCFNRDTSQLIYHEYFASGWLLLAIALNGRWFLQQVRNFQPLEKVENPPASAEVQATQ